MHAKRTEDGASGPIRSTGDAAHVTLVATAAGAGAVDSRILRFNEVGDMPADITSAANVAADRVKLDGFAAGARRVQVLWHGAGIAGPDTQATQAFFGEVALGALVTINADDDATANGRLTYADLTGGGTSSAGVANRFMVSKNVAVLDLVLDEAIDRIDIVGVPNGLTTTNLDTLLPCFLEVRVIG